MSKILLQIYLINASILIKLFVSGVECDLESNFDDSVDDPNFIPSNTSDSECSISANVNVDNEIPDEINMMAMEIEENLIGKRKTIQVKRNSGQAYVTRTGAYKKARTFTALINCRKKCQSKITVGDQKNIFTYYWNLGKMVLFLQICYEFINKVY